MKLYAILLLFAVFSYSQALKCTPAVLNKAIKTCLKETKCTEVDFLDLLAVKKARSDNAKCFRACLMKRCDYLDAKGNTPPVFPKDTGVMLGAGDPEKSKRIEDATASCVKTLKHKEDLCEYTEDMFECITDSCKTCGITVPVSKL